jgi:hypothetical protein
MLVGRNLDDLRFIVWYFSLSANFGFDGFVFIKRRKHLHVTRASLTSKSQQRVRGSWFCPNYFFRQSVSLFFYFAVALEGFYGELDVLGLAGPDRDLLDRLLDRVVIDPS